MSENRPFDAALEILKAQELKLRRPFFQTQTGGPRREQIRRAIRILKDWPKWKPLIEAAGNVDKTRAIQGLKNMENIGDFFPNEWSVPLGFEELLSQNKESAKEIRALLESLPDKEEK